jgi:hypothetical protein
MGTWFLGETGGVLRVADTDWRLKEWADEREMRYEMLQALSLPIVEGEGRDIGSERGGVR